MLASMIFRKEPFFHGHDNYDQVKTRRTLHGITSPSAKLGIVWHYICVQHDIIE